MKLFRRHPRSASPVDYGQVVESVRERRREKRREPGQDPEGAQASPEVVRAYRPERRLRAIDQQTQQMVRNAADIPRESDPDEPPSEPQPVDRFQFAALCAVNALFTGVMLMMFFGVDDSDALSTKSASMAGSAAGVLLLYTSVLMRVKLGWCFWSGIAVAVIEAIVAQALWFSL